MVGVANGHSTITPCNSGLQKLADAAIDGDRRLQRQFAGVRHADDLRRHRHGHRGHEVLAGVARGHRRLHRDLRQRPVDGRRDRHRRLRQEHARRHDGHRALQRAGDLRLRRHRQAGPLQGQGPDHRLGLRGRRRVHRGPPERDRLQGDRAPLHPGLGLVRRHVHREHDEFVVRGARHVAALLVDPGQSGPGEDRLDGGGRARPGRCDQEQPAAVRHHHPQVDRERRQPDHGRRRLDQRSAALTSRSRTRPAFPWTIDDFETIRRRVPVLCDLKPSGRYVATDLHQAGGIPAGAEDPAGQRPAARRLHDDHRQDHGRDAGRHPGRAARRPGRDPSVRQPDVQAGSPGDPEGQPRDRRLRRQDHRV